MEIKFRAFDTDTNKFLWTGFTEFMGERHQDKPIEERTGCIVLNPEYGGLGNRIIFSQWTGWKDANQQDLYVGDNIEIGWADGNTTCETITYDDYYGYFKYGNNPLCELKDPIRSFVIVGNIHELQSL